MKINFNKLVLILILLCFFSSFIAFIPIYVFFYWLTSIVILIWLIYNNKFHIKFKILKIIIYILLFLVIGTIVYIFNISQSSFTILFKIYTNFFFLLTSILFLSSINLMQYSKLISNLFKLTIILTVIQILINVFILNLWLTPFSISDSTEAFALTQSKILFGNNHKNIWATKFVFVSIIFFSGVYLNVFTLSRIYTYIYFLLCCFSIFYLSSRTATMIFLLFFIILIWYKYSYNLSGRWKVIYFVCILALIFLIIPVIYQKILRLDSNIFNIQSGHGGDGFKARVILWFYIIDNIKEINLFWGNGILYIDYFFEGVFVESNIHNAFANIWIDLGLFGLLLYLLIFWNIFKYSNSNKALITLLSVPLISCLFVQYLGYDNDIVLYLIMVFYLGRTRFEQLYHKNLVYI